MRYLIIDEKGVDIGGSLCREWNSLQDYLDSLRRNSAKNYYAGDIRVVLLFGDAEIKDDAQRKAMVQGRTIQKQNRDENKSIATVEMFQEVGEDDYWPSSKRVIASAINDAESVLYSIAKHQISGMRNADNQDDKYLEYCMELRVPETFSDTSVSNILHMVHDYIVAKVLWEWANLTHVPFAEYWLAKMELCKESLIKEAHRVSSVEDAKIAEGWL